MLIYKNIFIYRIIMNILYLGKYNSRFKEITNLIEVINPKSVLELCFADIKVAKYCKLKKIKWKGIDINQNFVFYAKKNDFNAQNQDLNKFDFSSQNYDLVLIIGSLYHFRENINNFLLEIFTSTDKLLISEPTTTLTQNYPRLKNIFYFLSGVQDIVEFERYTFDTLKKDLEKFCKKNYKLEFIKNANKESIYLISK